MITYFYNEKGDITLIDYGVYPLSEEEQANPNKIQLESEYKVENRDGFMHELYVEDGTLKHKYIEIPKTESEELEAVKTELLAVQKATAEIFELISNGGSL